ncbi:MAG: ADOP family duplicated permease [Acidobacteriota bacterium]
MSRRESGRPSGWRRLFRFPGGRFQLERDLDDELSFHLEQRTRKGIDEGLAPDEARRRAEQRFGDLGTVRERCQEISRSRARHDRLRRARDEITHDLASAVRTLRRAPLFALGIVAILAVGIAAATACFSLLWQVVLRPLPMPEAGRVQAIGLVSGGAFEPRGAGLLSPGVFMRLGEGSPSLESLAAMTEVGITLTGRGLPERLEGMRVSRNYFSVLGVSALRGATLEAASPGEPVVVISHRLWTRRFEADPELVGRDIELDGVAHRVLGVMPQSLDLTARSMQLWLPLDLGPGQRENLGTLYLGSLGRLAPGASPALLREELRGLRDRHDLRDFRGTPLEPRVMSLSKFFYGDLEPRLWLLLAVAGAVLLIACGNVANLLLAMGISRQHEMGVRAALGAGRARLTRQILIESAALGLLGALLGALASHFMVTALASAIPLDLPRLGEARTDGAALAFAVAVGVFSAMIAGALPARRLSQEDLQSQLIGGARSGASPASQRLRDVLVAAQVTVTTLLVVTAGLLVQTLLHLERVDLGFRVPGLITAQLALPRADYPDAANAMGTYLEAVQEISRLPSVEAATVSSGAPFAGFTGSGGFRLLSQAEAQGVSTGIRLVGPGSFETYGIPMVAGRGITPQDLGHTQLVAVINRTLAERLGASPGLERDLLGSELLCDLRDFRNGEGEPLRWRVVGIAEDTSSGNLRDSPRPTVYLAMTQTPAAPWEWSGRRMLLAARVSGEPMTLARELRSAVAAIDARLPIFDVRSMADRLREAVVVERLLAQILTVVSLFGIVLAMGGIFALVAFRVGQRSREIGVRLAMGATLGQLRTRFVGLGMRPVIFGLIAGSAAALAAARLLEEMLFGVTAFDWRTLAGVAACLMAAAFAACYLPTAAIARVDPVRALKDE